MLSFRYLALLLWISTPTYAESPADTALAHQYYQTADSLTEQGKYGEANDLFRQAQRIYQSAGDWEKYIACLNSVAYNLAETAKYDSAMTIAQRALELSRKYLSTDHTEVANAYRTLGVVQGDIGNYSEALRHHREELRILKEYYPENSPSVANAYESVGIIYQYLGQYEQALVYYNKVLNIRKLVHPEFHPDVATVYSNIGMMHNNIGTYDQALAYHRQALAIRDSLLDESHPHLAISYDQIGVAYERKDYPDKALSYHKKALKIRKKSLGEDHISTMISYNNIGVAYMRDNDYPNALAYYQKALSISRHLFGELHFGVAINYHNIGTAYGYMGSYEQEMVYQRKALNVLKSVFGKLHPAIATTYNDIGEIYQKQHKYDSALSSYQKSLIANNAFTNDNISLENYLDGNHLLFTLKNKVESLLAIGSDSLAMATYLLADSLISLVQRSYLTHNDKLSLNRTAKQIHEGAIQTVLQLHSITNEQPLLQQAFYFSERSKANLLAIQLSASEARQFGQVPRHLLQQEDSLRFTLSFLRTQLMKGEDKNVIQNQLFSTQQRYDSLINALEQEYPDYYQLKYDTRTATVPGIQTQLAPEEAVISYFVGDSTYYAFAITSEYFRVVPLPVDTLLSKRVTSIRQMLSADSVAPGEYQQAAYELYQQLLTPVVADSAFASVRKLTIIPDGVLGYLPFELLLTQPSTPKGNYATLPYLLQDYTIHYSYSATWLFHPFSRPANPVTDQYIAFAPHYPALVSDSVQRLAFGRFRDQVAPLRWNQQEVKNINQHLSGVGYAQGAAVERRFKEEVSQYSIIHLAMHALVDDQNPMYSRFVFSEDTTDTQEDGYLNAYELYNMELPAELAVLSACETGYGKLEQGEGIMSLARAFAYAGCPSIVMSHWLVDDKASAQLMDYFYRYLSQGLPKDEALRQAKLTYLETASVQKAHPFFWGNFVLMGNADPIFPHKAGTRRLLYATGGLLLLLGLVGITYRYRHRLGVMTD